MDVVKMTKCTELDCVTTASFGPSGGKRSRCSKHKLPGHINLNNIDQRCTFDKCVTFAVFGLPDGKPLWCLIHKPENAIDVKNPTCFSPGCLKRPSYNDPGKPPIACRYHKSGTMVNTKVPTTCKCHHPECQKQSTYGPVGAKKATWCKEHSPDGSVDLKNMTRCHELGCHTRCSFGIHTPTHCRIHKTSSMKDLVHAICSCGTRAQYGYPTLKATACGKCKVPGMITSPTKVCSKAGCRNYALHGLTKPERCDLHKLPTDKNLIEGQCSKCNLIMALINDLCEFCRPLQVKATLTQYNLKNNLSFYSHDQVIDSKCNLKRPDFVYDAGTHFVIVEVDENQHRSYAEECEQTRMWSIRQALGLPTTFIRFNPDSFKTSTGRPGRASDVKREETLCNWLTTLLKVEPTHSCSALYLFYDGWREGSSVKVEEVPHPVLK